MKNAERTGYYPLFLRLAGAKCVVVGGGEVAVRKVRSLLECGASVTVVSPEVSPELAGLRDHGQVRLVHRQYRNGDLRGAVVAIAATDNREVNEAVSREARSERVLVNVVDDAALSDFIVPSFVRRGDVSIAVSTGGRSPALARKLRTRLEKEFDHAYGSLALLIDEVRTELRTEAVKPDAEKWQQVLDLDLLLGLLRNGDGKKAKEVLLNALRGHGPPAPAEAKFEIVRRDRIA